MVAPTIDWPELDSIEEGYYAVLDPADQATVTYWRRTRTARTNSLRPWPAGARYGPPVPLRSQLPADPHDRVEYVSAWSKTRRAYLEKVVAAIAVDPKAAAALFAERYAVGAR
ncbi:hypothetical protein ACFPN0_14910 [Kitasatospora cinereorecta]